MSICFGCGENPCVCPSRTGNEAAHQAPPVEEEDPRDLPEVPELAVIGHLADCYKDPGVANAAMYHVLNRAVRALVKDGFDVTKVLSALAKMTVTEPKEPREPK